MLNIRDRVSSRIGYYCSHFDLAIPVGRVTGKASDLSRPLDMDLLDTDFDFESNLKLFNKEVR